MKNSRNVFAQLAHLFLLAFCLTAAGQLSAQTPLPCNSTMPTNPAYKGYIAHLNLNANKSLMIRAYLVPADLNENFLYDVAHLGEILRRSPKVGLVRLTKANLRGNNCFKATGKLVTLDPANPTITSFTFEWTVQDASPKIQMSGVIATHYAYENDVFFYKGTPGGLGVLLTIEKK